MLVAGDNASGTFAERPTSKLPALETFLHKGPDCHVTPVAVAAKSAHYNQHGDLWGGPASFIRAFRAIAFADRFYDKTTTPTIPLKIVEQPLYNYSWIPDNNETLNLKHGGRPSYADSFACLLTFESGGLRSKRQELESVMAVSSRNSIFVAAIILSDPAHASEGPSIRRLVGNIGKPGITLLVPPPNLLIKSPDRDFRAVRHAKYDLERVDSCSGTSLHLSFTKWIVPLNRG